MAEEKFNEAEQFLLQDWKTALEVEESIEQVRQKYQRLCERIADAVTEDRKGDFDIKEAEVTLTSGAWKKPGVIVLARKSWPSNGKNYPSGIWVKNLRLEYLVDADQDAPMIGFWLIWSEQKDDQRYAPVEEEIQAIAKSKMSSDEIAKWTFGDNEETALIGRTVASKREIIELLSKGETDRFVEIFVDQIDELVALVAEIEMAISKTAKAE